MSFPLYYILAPFALFAFVYIIFVLMDLYHLAHFAEVHFAAFFATFVFFAGIVYVLFWVWTLAQPVNWNEVLIFFKDITFKSPSTF